MAPEALARKHHGEARSFRNPRAPSAPLTKPTGPVRRMPSKGPRLPSGQIRTGPMKPKAKLGTPTHTPPFHVATPLSDNAARPVVV